MTFTLPCFTAVPAASALSATSLETCPNWDLDGYSLFVFSMGRYMQQQYVGVVRVQ